MPPIEVGPAGAVGAVDARLTRTSGGENVTSSKSTTSDKVKSATTASTSQVASPSVETTDALDAGAAPVDTDRVAVVRKAVESGNYPVIPTQIADAMIAAGVLLRSHK